MVRILASLLQSPVKLVRLAARLTLSPVMQEVACIFLVLCALLQLNILSTRNPNVWWWFNKKQGSGAPPPSLILVGFVSIFLLAATFVGVYWPDDVRPDGGRGWMQGAGGRPPPPPAPSYPPFLPTPPPPH